MDHAITDLLDRSGVVLVDLLPPHAGEFCLRRNRAHGGSGIIPGRGPVGERWR
jgi:hypothetical protein